MATVEPNESVAENPPAQVVGFTSTSSPSSAPVAGSELPDQSLIKLAGSLKPGQLWGLLGALAAVIVGSFALGGVLQSGRDDATVNARDQQIISLKSDIATRDQQAGSLNMKFADQFNSLNTKLGDQSRTIAELTKNLTGSLNEKDMYELKAELLDKYLAYTLIHSEVSKTLFVNVVCSLWKESEKDRISIHRDRPDITANQIRTGLDPATEALLRMNNVPENLIDRIRTPEKFVEAQPSRINVSPSVAPVIVQRPQVFPGQQADQIRQNASEQVEKYLSGLNIIKVVSFPDGSQYRMPDEIALAVHTNPECAPH
jgi:hypothetical protein